MAEGGVSHPRTRWIVVSPGRDHAVWCETILAAAAQQGQQAVILSPDAPPTEGCAIICDDLDLARSSAAAEDIAVLPLEPFIDLTGCETDDEVNVRVIDTSRKIVTALSAEQAGFRFAAMIDGKMRLHDLSITPPKGGETEGSAKEEALARACAVYRNDTARWSSAAFNFDPRNKVSAPTLGELDVTGRPRFLVSGPYLLMPSGGWRATIRLSFDHHLSRAGFRVDWGGVDTYASHEFRPQRAGVFELALDHHWEAPASAELRVLVLEGVFHGAMTFHGATIEKVSS
ncbi:hypothetical protein [Brevundimonas sp.]|uniref:hypothetical protein n=1 Tax=Brevundimonas sp. TaxID=1871086 RepID=UPI0035B085FB